MHNAYRFYQLIIIPHENYIPFNSIIVIEL